MLILNLFEVGEQCYNVTSLMMFAKSEIKGFEANLTALRTLWFDRLQSVDNESCAQPFDSSPVCGSTPIVDVSGTLADCR